MIMFGMAACKVPSQVDAMDSTESEMIGQNEIKQILENACKVENAKLSKQIDFLKEELGTYRKEQGDCRDGDSKLSKQVESLKEELASYREEQSIAWDEHTESAKSTLDLLKLLNTEIGNLETELHESLSEISEEHKDIEVDDHGHDEEGGHEKVSSHQAEQLRLIRILVTRMDLLNNRVKKIRTMVKEINSSEKTE